MLVREKTRRYLLPPHKYDATRRHPSEDDRRHQRWVGTIRTQCGHIHRHDGGTEALETPHENGGAGVSELALGKRRISQHDAQEIHLSNPPVVFLNPDRHNGRGNTELVLLHGRSSRRDQGIPLQRPPPIGNKTSSKRTRQRWTTAQALPVEGHDMSSGNQLGFFRQCVRRCQ